MSQKSNPAYMPGFSGQGSRDSRSSGSSTLQTQPDQLVKDLDQAARSGNLEEVQRIIESATFVWKTRDLNKALLAAV